MSTLIYVHGTNGSGKSTLARVIIREAGGVYEYRPSSKPGVKCGITYTQEGVSLMGRYATATGGVDGISPYAAVLDEMLGSALFPESRVFAEGLVAPGLDTCKKMASYFGKTIFIHLDVPLEKCILQVLKRRKAAGNTKPYDPANLYRKAKSAASWANRLEEAGLDVRRLTWMEAYELCIQEFNL